MINGKIEDCNLNYLQKITAITVKLEINIGKMI